MRMCHDLEELTRLLADEAEGRTINRREIRWLAERVAKSHPDVRLTMDLIGLRMREGAPRAGHLTRGARTSLAAVGLR